VSQSCSLVRCKALQLSKYSAAARRSGRLALGCSSDNHRASGETSAAAVSILRSKMCQSAASTNAAVWRARMTSGVLVADSSPHAAIACSEVEYAGPG
jgi:hypothetical protein